MVILMMRFQLACLGSRRSTLVISVATAFSLFAILLTAHGSEVPPALQPADNLHLAIPKAGMGKDYLMTMSVIPQSGAATSRGLSGKVVQFELFHDAVDMYESTEGMVVTRELPSRLLLTSFPIVSQDENRVVIDFNAGMRRVFSQGWYASGRGFNSIAAETAEEVPHGRVFEISNQEGQLVIRQSVQARNREFMQNVEARYEVRYFFSPYERGDFEAKEMPRHETRYARFWELPGRLELESGRTSVKMGRFDAREPIRFYYSENTPEDYVQAVKDGVLYWNRAFGRKLVEVEPAPEGVTAPDARYNIVQWVPWDNAGFAYADVLFDPLSGQARHGQAYITSVFGISGKARARQLIRAMRELAAEGEKADDEGDDGGDDEHEAASSMSILVGQTACQMDPVTFAKQMADGLEELLANEELTDAAVLRASQDYVREVVSHEVGHVLGLRHNFGGSLAATLSPKELDEFTTAYITGQDLDDYKDKIVTSSMMEYSVFKAGMFIGWLIRETDAVLPHDKAAIQWGYFDDKSVVEDKMLFATDSDAGRYGDVATFDYGNEPLLSAYSELRDAIQRLPNDVIETFIRARAPRDPRDRVPLENVDLSYRGYASTLAAYNSRLLMWFDASVRSLKVENAFDYIGELNETERYKAHWSALTNQIEQLGGIDRVAFAWLPVAMKLETKKEPQGVLPAPKIVATNLTARLKKLLESPAYAEFVGLDDQVYSFTDEEKKLILERGTKLFAKLEEAVLDRVLRSYEKATRDLSVKAHEELVEDDVVAAMEKRIIELARYVITAKDEDRRIEGKINKSYVEVVDFKYKLETRLAAARALNDKIGSYSAWAKEAKGAIHKALQDDIDAALNIKNFKSFKDSMLSRPLRNWYLKQQQILKLLPPTAAPKEQAKPAEKK